MGLGLRVGRDIDAGEVIFHEKVCCTNVFFLDIRLIPPFGYVLNAYYILYTNILYIILLYMSYLKMVHILYYTYYILYYYILYSIYTTWYNIYYTYII